MKEIKKAAKYYIEKKKVLREDARNKYRNLSEIEKEKKKKSKKQISHDY